MSFCCCFVESKICAVFSRMELLGGITELHQLISAYGSFHGIKQPFQTSDDPSFDDELLLKGKHLTMTYTWDAVISTLYTQNETIFGWSIERSNLDHSTRCIKSLLPSPNMTDYHVSSQDWILTVRTGRYTGYEQKHIVGLEPKKDSEKIITGLWRYGSLILRSKLCRFAVLSLNLRTSAAFSGDEKRYMQILQKGAMEKLHKTLENEFRPIVNLEQISTNNNYESNLDHIRNIIEQQIS